MNALGKRLEYCFNYTGEPVSFAYPAPAGKDLLTGSSVTAGQQVTIKPWDLMIVEQP